MRISDGSSDVCSSDLFELRRQLLDLGQAEETQDAYIAPAQVEFVPFGREFGRGTVGVVIVVQFFTANDDAPGRHIGAGIGTGVIAIAPGMADTVDDAGGPEGYPGHLDSPDGKPPHAEQGQVQRSEEHTSELQSLMRNSYACFCLKKKTL